MTGAHKTRRGLRVEGADFFCGGGGASAGVVGAGVELLFAANHDAIAIATHEANHPGVDHYQVDLIEYDIAKLPAVRLAHFSPSCKHHSQANATKVYEQPDTLFDFNANHDGLEEARSGYANSERSRVTMSCVLRYAAAHHPELMVVENVVEAAHWGPGRDGTTFAWWLGELDRLGYVTKPMFLCSALFGVPQVRDRMYVVCWRQGNKAPDLVHRVNGRCRRCDRATTARQVFRRPTAAWPLAEWGKLGKQYDYRCDDCNTVVDLDLPAAAGAIDWTDLGLRIGDRVKPLADTTMDRIRRGLARFGGSPPFVAMTRTAGYGSLGWPVDRPTGTMTTRADHCLIADAAVIPFRQNTLPTPVAEPTFTQTAQQRPGLALQVVTAGNTFERPGSMCRTRPVDEPSWAIHTTPAFGVASMFATDTIYHDTVDPFGTMTRRDATSLASFLYEYDRGGMRPVDGPAQTQTAVAGAALATVPDHIDVNDINFRMLKVDEIRRIMAYPDDYRFARPDGKQPSERDKVRLLGDGVTPPVLSWLTDRCLATLDS